MIRMPLSYALVLAVVSLGVSCRESSPAAPGLRFSDPGKPIGVKVGQEFVIEIRSNPTVAPAYRYELRRPLPVGVDFVGIDKDPTGIDDRKPGSSSSEGYRFKAVRAGSAAIVFGPPVPADTPNAVSPVTFSVTVTGP